MRNLFHFVFIILLTIGLQVPADAASKKSKRTKSVAQQTVKPMTSYARNAEAMALAEAMAINEGLDVAWVRTQIADAKFVPRIVQLMTPAAVTVKKNWAAYRERFVTPVHIAAGVAFWQRNKDTLMKAEHEYGVPPSIVLGILGVETIYGRNTGSFRVIDALATLSFNYPTEHPRREARVQYFRGELAQFLLLAKQMERDPKSYKGSYAGAMGWPQFMPSSWRKHAVDFDGDGRIDLWQSQMDMIGSVANYFKAYGYKPISTNLVGQEPSQSRIGLAFQPTVELENGDDAVTHYPVDDNFFVITKYNNSYYYAAAVLELGAAIELEIKNDKTKN